MSINLILWLTSVNFWTKWLFIRSLRVNLRFLFLVSLEMLRVFCLNLWVFLLLDVKTWISDYKTRITSINSFWRQNFRFSLLLMSLIGRVRIKQALIVRLLLSRSKVWNIDDVLFILDVWVCMAILWHGFWGLHYRNT